VLRLRSGDSLQYKEGFFLNEQGINIAALSASGKDKHPEKKEKLLFNSL